MKHHTPHIHPQDVYYMTLAIEQAKKGLFTTRPNPAVGCILVKDGKIIGEGHHPKAGEPHAEIFALRQAGEHAQGATAYVTLEPCSHTGRTPPCAQALIKAGIKRVVIAGLDPNPKVAGRGVAMLKNAGIEVVIGVATDMAESLNKGFLTAMKTGYPYVRLKIASSLDGASAMQTGESQWITSPNSREDVQKLRAISGAIITGSQTIIQDNPSLTVRSQQLGTDTSKIPAPKIVILDRRSRLNPQSPYPICQRPDTLFWRTDNLSQLLTTLVQTHQCYDILIEAGATVASAFLQANLVDEIILYQAPCFLGNNTLPITQITSNTLNQQLRYQIVSHETLDPDLKITLIPLSTTTKKT